MSTRRQFFRTASAIASVPALSGLLPAAIPKKKYNILWIGVDDLRVQLYSYGYRQMKTPNINRLAEKGVQFNRAYVQQAVCAASRASFLTGCRPDTTGVDYPYTPWFNDVFRKKHPTIVEFFHENGYYTRTLGKIHHGPDDKKITEPHFRPAAPDFQLKENQFEGKKPEWVHKVKPWEHAGLPDSDYVDGQIADETIATIRRAVKSNNPFFISPGFKKPHLPFVCPKKYFDMYTDKDIELAPHPKLGPDQHELTISHQTGASKWWKYKKEGIDKENARQLIHSYYACVSFIDAQVGKLLDELKRLDILDRTIIMFWSDHGWHLGDHGMWGKSTNYEWSTRSPLITVVPGMKSAGLQTDGLVEYVDMYPTLADLCGIKIPDFLEGTSFKPVLENPEIKWKKAAFSQFPRKDKEFGKCEGYTVRTKDFRFTQWRIKQDNKIVFEELYDNRKDLLESKNVIKNPEYAGIVKEHRGILENGWKKALPEGVKNLSNNPPGDDSFYRRGKNEYKELKELKKEKGKSEKSDKKGGSKIFTSENKPYLKRYIEKNPDADTNKDGILTRQEFDDHKSRK